jgi:ABC-type transport system involved in Fe-S cluster assembly fused permease/ATPase subunit
VVAEGRVQEEGAHQQLMDDAGLYALLASGQPG